MTDAFYKPRYQWRRTQINDSDPPMDIDWCGFNGVDYIGRIRQELMGPLRNQWQWSGTYPRTFNGPKPLPHSGLVNTASTATQKVEEFWDHCLYLMENQ